MAYFEAEQPRKKGPGRPRKYGKKIKVSDLFDQRERFSDIECAIYGKVETVSIASLNLLWKPTAGFIRFVLAVTKRGPIILMCSDLNQDPVAALELYCARVRIETMFDMLKNLMGVFHYRFWTKSLERHSRKPRKNKDLKKPTSGEKMGKVRICFAAYERFVMIGAIALGLLQLVSIKYEKSVWKEFKGFLRTKSRKLPSERTVKFVIADLLVRDLFSLAPGAVIREIQGYVFTKKVVEPACQWSESKPKPKSTVIET